MRWPVLAATSVCLLAAACGNDESTPGPTPPAEPPAGFASENLLIVPATTPAAPVVIWGNDGSRLLPLYTASGTIDQAVLVTSEGGELTLYLGNQWQVQHAVAVTTVVLFRNWTTSTVDLAAVDRNGVQTTREVPISSTVPSDGQDLEFTVGSVTVTGRDLERLGLAVTRAACAIGARSEWTMPSVITLGVTGCASTAASHLAFLSQESVSGQTAAALGRLLRDAGCASGEIEACITATVNGTANASDAADAYLQENPGLIQAGEGALLGGTGHVQVTLTWDAAVDLDLYVTEPTGFTMWFGAMVSPSGGRLDVDDMDGFGPENVYWPQHNAPPGNYLVSMKYFSGFVSPVTWTVQVNNEGTTESHTGSLAAAGDSVLVTRFTVGGASLR